MQGQGSDTDDGGDDSSGESFDYDYSDGGPVSEPEAAFDYGHLDGGHVSELEEGGLAEALVYTAVSASSAVAETESLCD